MASKYLYVDSTYRDRNQYPNPADFIVNWGYPRNPPNFFDPVLDGTPLESSVLQAGSTANTAVLSVTSSLINDFYNNLFIKLTTGPGANQFSIIRDYIGATQTATLNQN